MVDFARIIGFDWDQGNERKSVVKHDVTQAEAEQIFVNEPLIVADDAAHSDGEPRFHALGRTEAARLLHVTFTLRFDATRIRVVSARGMSRKERQIYEQKD